MGSEEEAEKGHFSKWKRPINDGLIFSGTASAATFTVEESKGSVTVTDNLGTHIWTFRTSEQALKKARKERKSSPRFQYPE